MHDTLAKRYRHLNFLQHVRYLEVRVPRVRLLDGGIRQVESDWAGKLAGFTLLFEALIMALCREMPFAAVARLVNLSWHRVAAICKRYVDLALDQTDFSEVKRLAADETARGHDYITWVADADERRVLFVTEGRDAAAIKAFADDLKAHGGDLLAIESISIDMSPAFIKGVTANLPKPPSPSTSFTSSPTPAPQSTRCVASSSAPTPRSRGCAGSCSRTATRSPRSPVLSSTCWSHRWRPSAPPAPGSTKEQLREIPARKPVNVVRAML